MKIFPALLLLPVLALAGCTLLPEPEKVALYQLPVPATQDHGDRVVNWSLRINKPATSEALNSRRILVNTADNALSALTGARWVSPVPVLWQDHLAAALLADRRIDAVSTDRDRLQADRALSGTLQLFQLDSKSSQVLIRYDALLIDTSSRRIIASHSFEAQQPVDGDDITTVIAGFAIATEQLTGEIMAWLLGMEEAGVDDQ